MAHISHLSLTFIFGADVLKGHTYIDSLQVHVDTLDLVTVSYLCVNFITHNAMFEADLN